MLQNCISLLFTIVTINAIKYFYNKQLMPVHLIQIRVALFFLLILNPVTYEHNLNLPKL